MGLASGTGQVRCADCRPGRLAGGYCGNSCWFELAAGAAASFVAATIVGTV